ncbi:MAG: helix-turn-helix domain-containing protein [Rubrivivax sp.]|nr:helix-turn-helix domain-containing protein [Rubrivivax sp.]
MTGADFNPGDDTKAGQCALVLAALRSGPKTTAELRAVLGAASSPAARVMDLRRAHRIETLRRGRMGCYVLMPAEVLL